MGQTPSANTLTLRHDRRSSIYSTVFTQNRHNKLSHFLFSPHYDTNASSSSTFLHPDILFDDNALS